MNGTYDLVIIGGGSAGLMAAAFACQLQARVALVEKHRVGGDCTWTGCVPSKTLLKAAKVAHEMRAADRYGLPPVEPKVDLKAVMDHVRSIVSEVYHEESPEKLRANNVDVFLGAAEFRDPHTLTVSESVRPDRPRVIRAVAERLSKPHDEVTLRARNVLIATGARPFIPPISGLEGVDFMTYENIWDLEVLPKHLLVVGAGPIGCEMSQAFRRLGSEVTLIEGQDRMLLHDEPEASQVLAQVFKGEGIDLRFEALVERAWQDADGIHLVAGGEEFVGDAILVTVGRRPNVDGLGLDKVGVAYSAAGIHVDSNSRASQQHIYAAGDCTGGHQFTHYAGWQGFLAARNALLPGSTTSVTERVPWTTFTDPEVAHVGMTEAQARANHSDEVMICEWPMARVDRARAEGDTAGFIKLVHMKKGTLLGATIVAGRAGEMIHEWIVALAHGLKVGDVASSLHVYPTYSTGSMQAAAHIRVARLLSGTSGQVIRGLSRLMR